jgi:thiol-disulfide isomerase/thioredoxin
MPKMFLNKIAILLSVFLFISCQEIKSNSDLISSPIELGIWRMVMDLNGNELPFNFTLNKEGETWKMVIINAEERIDIDEIVVKKDSIFINLPVFESEFKLSIVDSKNLDGVWINYYKDSNYKIKTKAQFGLSNRFSGEKKDYFKSIEGKYSATFSPLSENPSNAIAIFNQDNTQITGTFATETGDYRHLQGEFIKDTLFLSTFDGSHAFLFKAFYNDTAFNGTFWSGTHWKESWTAQLNEKAKLRNADSLTFIKEGFEEIAFSFPDSSGKIVSLSDSIYNNKVVIVQIMGSWCPNCLDETIYYKDLYDSYNKNGLEIIALAFERTRTKEQAQKNLSRLISKTNANYPILLAGSTREDKAESILPMLNHVMSYPTSIYIDKNKIVRKIHTGFYGPGTGQYYIDYKANTELFIENLLQE